MSLTFNFRLQQTVYAWAYGQPLKLLRPSPALLEVLQSLALDFSMASLERIEAWLQNEHAQRVAKQLPSRDAKSDTKLLLFLSAYTAEVLGRAMEAVPQWHKVDNIPTVSWLGPDHAQRPMLALTSVIHSCLTGESPDLLPQLYQTLNIDTLPASQRGKPLRLVELPAEKNFQAGVQLSPEQTQQLFADAPPDMSSEDLLSNFFLQAPRLFEHGQCVRAALIQASTALYVPRYTGGSTAEVVFDLSGRLSFEDLISIANHLFELKKKDTSKLPVPARLIAEHLQANGLGARMLDWDAPAKLLGWPLRMSSVWVEQKHLPDGMLSYDGLQLLIAPKNVSLYTMLLPRWYWSAEYLQRWQNASMARHGQLHDIDQLVRVAKLAKERVSAEHVTAEAPAIKSLDAPEQETMGAETALHASSHSSSHESSAVDELAPGSSLATAPQPSIAAVLLAEPVPTAEPSDANPSLAPAKSALDSPQNQAAVSPVAKPAAPETNPAVQEPVKVPVKEHPADPPPSASATPSAGPSAKRALTPPSLQTLNRSARKPSWLSRYGLWLAAIAALAVLVLVLR